MKNLLLPLMNFGSNPTELKVVETKYTASCKLFKCYKFVVCRTYYIPFLRLWNSRPHSKHAKPGSLTQRNWRDFFMMLRMRRLGSEKKNQLLHLPTQVSRFLLILPNVYITESGITENVGRIMPQSPVQCWKKKIKWCTWKNCNAVKREEVW